MSLTSLSAAPLNGDVDKDLVEAAAQTLARLAGSACFSTTMRVLSTAEWGADRQEYRNRARAALSSPAVQQYLAERSGEVAVDGADADAREKRSRRVLAWRTSYRPASIDLTADPAPGLHPGLLHDLMRDLAEHGHLSPHA